jgi:pyruvate, water dikinase
MAKSGEDGLKDETSQSLDEVLKGLQDRAKELFCLYQVGETLRATEIALDAKLTKILEVIPPGFRYTDDCEVRLEFGGHSFQTPGFKSTAWVLEEPIVVHGEEVGALQVAYVQERPPADEGPFLREERKLLTALAEQIGLRLTNDMDGTWETVEGDLQRHGPRKGRKWKVILDFLERADTKLAHRISRRMLNHLRWKGVKELEDLPGFQRSMDLETTFGDENQPLVLRDKGELPIPTDTIFRIAADHCEEEEIIGLIQTWTNRDRLSFLINTLEWQDSSLGDITDALGRFQVLGMREDELPPSVVKVLRAALVRRFFSEEIDYINIAKELVTLEDFYDLSQHLIHTPNSHGKLGGKSAGVFLARKIVERRQRAKKVLEGVRFPRTWYVASDGVISFIRHNSLEDVYDRKYMEIDQVRQQYPYVVQVFKSSPFPPELLNGLSRALDDLGERPLIVRSSSLLEDRTGSAFSGKYKSLFLANLGTKAERLSALLDAVAEVYASIFSPDPIEYRAERNLLDVHEEMGIMIQEVVGTRVGKYFLPAYSGVAFSNNEFRWSPRIKREDGLVRLVFGLGTRAVDRIGDDYPVLLAPGQPGLRVNTTSEEVLRYSPKRVDLINLETRSFETMSVADFLRECGTELPQVRKIVSLVEHDQVVRPGALGLDFSKKDAVVTFEGLLADTPFLAEMSTILKVLRESMGTPVDIEFASDGKALHLLQCRSQSFIEGSAPSPIPRDIPRNRILFTANRYISDGRVPDITHVVYVDPEKYSQLGTLDEMKDVGRAVSRLNKVLPRRKFILMGPGRWGSRGDIRLGVSVTYSDINNTSLLVEIAHRKGSYVPDLSFGTHFFQDLVEAQIRYLPLYPDDDGNILNSGFFRGSTNLLPELVPEYAHLSDTVRVVEVPREAEGQILRVLLNADLEEAVGLLAEPGPAVEVGSAPTARHGRLVAPEPLPEDHWQWRLRMAERLASRLDPDRFGVKAMWVFGGTKNGTAGPGSDIDLLVHFDGTKEQRKDLLLWLEGWSMSLAEMNYVRTGYRSDGLLDARLLSDKDIKNRTGYSVKIASVTDPAHPLPLGTALPSS